MMSSIGAAVHTIGGAQMRGMTAIRLQIDEAFGAAKEFEKNMVELVNQSDPSQNGIYVMTPYVPKSPATGTISERTQERRARRPAPEPFYIQQERKRRKK